jgi:hypothetical protein
MGNKVNSTSYTPTKPKKGIDLLGLFGERENDSRTRSAKINRDCLYAEDKIFENYESKSNHTNPRHQHIRVPP